MQAAVNRPDFDWLNDESRVFLQRGYLMEGATAENRISEIAEHAEKILGIEGYADKFYRYMARGYYSLSSPVWANFGLDRGLPISCVTGDTWINTDKGGKQARDIEIGDMVLTHKNRYRPVTKIIPTKNKDDIWQLEVTGVDTAIYITGNHPVLTNLGWVPVEELDNNEHYIAINGDIVSPIPVTAIPFVDGLVYSPIKSLIKTDKIEDVWDFTVEEDHSFTVSGIVIHNCFGSYITDSIEGILTTHHEIGMMNKYGGGTSAYFGNIRPRGSVIRNNGKSNGSYSFLKMFDSLIDVISQGTTRRGMMAAYIDIDHADIDEWLDIHTEGNPIQLMYYGVCVGNDWLEEMRNGDKRKQDIWRKVLTRKKETGIPYIFFKDNVNNQKPKVYRDKNMEIYASNLCVTGDTTILTKEYGHTPIAGHVNESVTVWNGVEWSENVQLVKTGENQSIYRVHLSNGRHVDCTDYHKWYVHSVDNPSDDITMKRTSELMPGDTLERFIDPFSTFKSDVVFVISVQPLEVKQDTYCCTEPKRNKVIFNGVLTGNCVEIALPSNEEESFVCCLSSLNLLHYDEWKDTDAVETLTYFLEAVMTEFIRKAKGEPGMDRAIRFAERHRALGVGVLGWHSLLQSKMYPFESMEAMMLNNEVFRLIEQRANAASVEMAKRYGEPEVMKGYGRRHTTLTAIAPTKSSSFILGGVSPSIEPFKSNYYIKDLSKIKTVFKNPYLVEVLRKYDQDTPDTWDSISKRDGSVQHLSFLSEHEKNVFKTFSEISQLTVIQQAAQRQKYIDQGQSINLMIHPTTEHKER